MVFLFLGGGGGRAWGKFIGLGGKLPPHHHHHLPPWINVDSQSTGISVLEMRTSRVGVPSSANTYRSSYRGGRQLK